MKVLYLLMFAALCSCSAEWHLGRAITKKSPQYAIDYLASKYGEFIRQKDTTIIDTTYYYIHSFDTMRVTKNIDTIVINKNNQTINVIRHYDTIFVKGSEVRDTIIKYINVSQYSVTGTKEIKGSYWIWYVLVLSLLAVIILLLIKK